MAYKTSHKALFDDGMAKITPRVLTERQRRYFFLSAERRKLADDGAVKLGKGSKVNRYWSEALQAYRGQEIVVRYDPDDFAAPVMVETLDGVLIEEAVPIIEKRGFNSSADAREHARSQREYVKCQKKSALALKRMDALEAEGEALVPHATAAPSVAVVKADFTRKPSAKADPEPSIDVERLKLALAMQEQHVRLYG